MYLPRHFEEARLDVVVAFLRAHPLATLVSAGAVGLTATPLPLLWSPEPAPLGTLRGHLARANPHAAVLGSPAPALAIFSGPQAYVSPSWYASKREHGRVVPTWNYVTVHAHGVPRLVDDPDWLRAFVERLTDAQEAGFDDPWHVGDAPAAYLDGMLCGIAGVEMPVERLEGKWKLGQNRPAGDYAGVVAGLEQRGDADSLAVAGAMAAWRRDRPR